MEVHLYDLCESSLLGKFGDNVEGEKGIWKLICPYRAGELPAWKVKSDAAWPQGVPWICWSFFTGISYKEVVSYHSWPDG